jgi:hypothetical protein
MRIERLIPCPPKDLWRALIHHTEVDERGAVLRLAFPGGVSAIGGTITVYESHKVLQCVRGGDVLRWELSPRGDMTLLVFTHAEDAAPWLAWIDSIAAAATQPAEAAVSP